MSKPWESPEGKSIWKTKAQYFTWLRGNLRKIWSDYPVRKEWKKRSLRPVTIEERKDKVYHPSTKNVGQCVFCKKWMAGSHLECDHIIESDGCYSEETAVKFLWHCAGQTADNFQLVCKPCHKIKSYSEAHKLTFEEATISKKAIAICKGDVKLWLEQRSITPASNATKRRQQVMEVLKNE